MKKPVVRVISLIIVLMLVLGMLSGALAMFASAAVSQELLAADTTVSPGNLTIGKIKERVKITFRFKPSDAYDGDGPVGELSLEDFSIPAGSSFAMSTKSRLKIDDSKSSYYEATISDILYNGGSTQALELYVANNSDPDEPFYFYVPLPSKYFTESSEAEGEAPKSNIVWQSTIVRNAEGQKVGKIDKNTGRVTVEISFYDIGLKNESSKAIDDAKKYVFITSPVGFKMHQGTMGKLERVNSSAEYPRFKATFEEVEFSGNVDKMNFRVQYEFSEYAQSIEGTGEATLFQIAAESSSEEETETAPLKPNVIVQEYSYGENAIIAGNEFDLNMVFTNTSRTVAVENVVMKVNPASGFEIRAASNTVYFPSIGAGESKPYSVALKALPSQNAGVAGQNPTDYSVTIEFSYQYQINKKGDYGDNATSVKIAIPVEQLDRFIVDEITEYTSYMQVGQEGYLTVPITNKGKSSIMNISGTVESKSGMEFVAPPVYYGNLEAGKSAGMNINITINTAGEFSGEAVITYEDENMNQKELRQPFIIMVEEPYVPPVEMPETPDIQPQDDKMSPYSVTLFILGGLMLASPAAMILMKRVKARGNEDFDEDF